MPGRPRTVFRRSRYPKPPCVRALPPEWGIVHILQRTPCRARERGHGGDVPPAARAAPEIGSPMRVARTIHEAAPGPSRGELCPPSLVPVNDELDRGCDR